MYLIFDTETTGFPIDFQAPISQSDNWPRVVQLAWQVHDENGNEMASNTQLKELTGNYYKIDLNDERYSYIDSCMIFVNKK